MRFIIKGIEVILVVLMFIMIASVGLQVFYRYVLSSPLGWVEEIARACLGWITFLGTSVAIYRAKNIKIHIIRDIIPQKWERMFYFISLGGVLIFFTVLFFYGMQFTLKFMHMRSPYLNYSLGLNYISIPVSSLLVIAIILSQIWSTIKN